jgi:hypothetical protein
MATSSSDSIFALGTTNVIVPAGTTNAVLIAPIAGQNSTILKFLGGGTCGLYGIAAGATATAAQLASVVGNHYTFTAANETLNLDGGPRFYIWSAGATSVVAMVVGKTAGF